MIILDGVPFDRVSGISLVHGPDGEPVLIRPWQGHPNPRGRALHKHADGPFARLVLDALPRARGVYAIAGDTGFVWYVGRARDSIAARWGPAGYRNINAAKCYQGGQPTTCKINGLITATVTAGTGLSLYAHLTEGDPAPLEARLITLLRPPWNGQIPFSPPDWLDELGRPRRVTGPAT
jgi:hypothetical protein